MSDIACIVLAPLIAFLVSLAATPLVRWLALRFGVTDAPDARRVHLRPTARAGGLAIAAAIVVAVALAGALPPRVGFGVLAGGALLLIVGVADDVWSLPARTKLLAQVVAAFCAVLGGMRFSPLFAWVSSGALSGGEAAALDVAVTVVWIVFITNAFNLSDGLDGLASGIALIAFGWLAAIGFRDADANAAALALVAVGALLGFLVYNFNPASIFLGDAGSLVLGYAIAVLPLAGDRKEVMGPLAAFLLVALPATDTLLAMSRRFLSRCLRGWGEGTFWRGIVEGLRATTQADRRHIHHRLLDLGFSQRRAVLLFYLAAITTGGLAFAAAGAPVWPVDVFALLVGLAVIGLVQTLGIDELQPARTGLVIPVLHRLAQRRWLVVAADVLLVAITYAAALWVNGKDIVLATTGTKFLIITAIQLVTFKLLGVYRTVWWATGAGDFALLFRSCAAAMVVSYLALRIFDMPTSATTALLRFFFFFPAVTAMRFSHVLLSNAARSTGRAERALICGTAAEARHAVAHLGRNGMSAVQPIGFIEIRPHLQGRQLGRLPVLGTLDGLAGIVTDRHVQHLVIADPALRGEALRWARAVCRHFGIALHRYVEKLVPVEHTSGAANGGAPRGGLPVNGGSTGIVPVAAIAGAGAAASAGDGVSAALRARAGVVASPTGIETRTSAWRAASRSYKPIR